MMKRATGFVTTTGFFDRRARAYDIDDITAFDDVIDKLLRNATCHRWKVLIKRV